MADEKSGDVGDDGGAGGGAGEGAGKKTSGRGGKGTSCNVCAVIGMSLGIVLVALQVALLCNVEW